MVDQERKEKKILSLAHHEGKKRVSGPYPHTTKQAARKRPTKQTVRHSRLLRSPDETDYRCNK